MNVVTIRRNSIDPSFDERNENVPNVPLFLMGYFKEWPKTAVIYKNNVSSENIVPLSNAEELSEFAKMQGEFIVVIYPAGVVAALATLVWAANIGIALFAGGKKKSTSDQVAQKQAKRDSTVAASPNNGLSARTNSQRLNQRIPEIVGSVRSIPDLLLNPYIIYKNNQEIELGYYCVGRGKYDISDIRDGDTKIADIGRNASVVVYGPNTSPNSGSPQLTVGNSITEPFVSVKPCGAVTGQTLFAPNLGAMDSDDRMRAYSNGSIYYNPSSGPPWGVPPDTSWSENFQIGDWVTLSFTGAIGGPDISGDYQVLDVSGHYIYLKDVNTVNANWASISSGGYAYVYLRVAKSTASITVGPFIVEDADSLYVNIVADGGIYAELDSIQYALSVDVEITAQEVDDTDTPFGTVHTNTITIVGSNTARSRVAITGVLSLPSNGRYQVSVIRSSDTDLGYAGTIVDSIICESIYAVKAITQSHFGDVTTMRTMTYAASGTLKIKERKLNCLAKRIIPVRQPGGSYVDGTSSKFADILRFVSLDTKIGNRQLSELDLTNFYDTQDEIEDYFGTSKAIEFNYTFDDDSFSFEEIVKTIAEAVFCIAYRQGSVIRVSFEKETNNSVLLFNHRNKIPNTENRTVRFGSYDDKDGIELEYVDPKDGAKVTFYLPEDQSAINPEKITQLGVTNKLQAYFHAHRLFNKQLYQNTVVEFDALQEASMLILNQRIQVADNTRPETWDGEVINQVGTLLTLSQDFVFESGKSYTIFLQNVDGTVQSVAITPGALANQVVLATATTLPLAIASDYYTRSTYEIVENSSVRKRAFLVDEKSNRDNFIVTVKAINYDSRYYEADTDYIEDVVDINGNII